MKCKAKQRGSMVQALACATCVAAAMLQPLTAIAVGYDEFNQTSHLKNGWLVDSAALVHEQLPGPYIRDPNHAGADITDLRVGTDQPYVKVRVWMEPGSGSVTYNLAITLKRPKNLPWSANPCAIL